MSGAGSNATVYAAGGGVYRVRLDDGAFVDAALRGRLKLQRRTGEKVVIGDRVQVELGGDAPVVVSVADRVTQIARRGPGGRKAKVIAANLDRFVAVMAARDPNPSMELIDRLLVVAEGSGLDPWLVVNKIDLEGGEAVADDLAQVYEPIGYEVLRVSATAGVGLEPLSEALCAGTSALVGPSGAGKSSLLNALDPSLELRIGELSKKTRRGRHTTVSSRLIPLGCGGLVADTPGFGDVGVWGVSPEELDACFPEILSRSEGCRFRGCAHDREPDCAVREAVEEGSVAESRFRSYRTLRAEAIGHGRP